MSQRLDIALLRPDHTEFPVEIALSTIKLDDERFVIGTVRDASIRRQAEIAVEHERSLLAAMNRISIASLEGHDDLSAEASARIGESIDPGTVPPLLRTRRDCDLHGSLGRGEGPDARGPCALPASPEKGDAGRAALPFAPRGEGSRRCSTN